MVFAVYPFIPGISFHKNTVKPNGNFEYENPNEDANYVRAKERAHHST
jgi:hypothetical protein